MLRSLQDLSSLTRDGTCGPCFATEIINHWTTRKSHDHATLAYITPFLSLFFFFFKQILPMYLFLAVLDLHCCEVSPLVVVLGFLTVVAPLVIESGL